MSDAVIQQIGTSREIYESPRTKFVAEFIGNNNLFPGVLKSRSGSMVLVESNGSIIYVRMSEGMKIPPVGREVYVSVRADLIHTGEHPNMGNSVQATYVATEFLGSLETDVFEIVPGLFVHVEQHRSITDRTYEIGEREVLSWPADAGVILSETGPAGQE
jgi:spermidine/putrescine transport system ATP-binding protein